MKLSDAILLGSTLRPQAFGSLYNRGGSCVVGAAFEAVGLMENAQSSSLLPSHIWPWTFEYSLTSPKPKCPECGASGSFTQIVATHLNDRHEWSRERIAEWVATVEPAETPAEQPAEILSEVLA